MEKSRLFSRDDFLSFTFVALRRTHHICVANISLRSNTTCPKWANITVGDTTAPTLLRCFFSLVLCKFSLEEFDGFDNRNRKERKAECDSIFLEIHGCKSECACEERNLADERGCHKAAERRKTENGIEAAEREGGAALRTHVEGMEDLAHGEGQERHGGTVQAILKEEEGVLGVLKMVT